MAIVTQKVIDHGWEKIKQEHIFKDKGVQVGLFGEGESPDENMAYLGVIQNFGAEIPVTDKMRGYLSSIGLQLKATTTHIRIPKRPFMAMAWDENEQELAAFILERYKMVIDGKMTLDMMMSQVGVKHEGQIKRSFTQMTFTPNHPVTVAQKGSSRPLIDKGILRNSVKYKIVEKK